LAYNHPDLGYINKIQKQLMATARPFAYNTGAGITGTVQVGALAVGTPTDGFATTGLEWWNGPDEDLGYVIAQSVPGDTQPTEIPGVFASVGFFRSDALTDPSFINIANAVAGPSGPFNTANAATSWLYDNGYWTSYPEGIAGSLVFNGTNQSLSLSPGVTFGAGAFTVEGWFFNTLNFTTRGILGSPVTSPTGCLNLYFANNTTITSDRNGGGGSFSYTMGSAITINAWHYLIYNRNANGVTAVYIDGIRCTATSSDTLNYNTSTDTVSRYYGGFWPGYWTNMRLTVGTAVYNSTSLTQSNPTAPLTVLANTKYLMLGAAVTTDSSGIQTVTNNNGVTQSSVLVPF
jgi:hypothetical protein